MKSFFRLFSIGCVCGVVMALAGCHSETGDSQEMASAESPAASLTAEEAAAYAQSLPDMDFDLSASAGEAASK